jgi:hypothetical protein
MGIDGQPNITSNDVDLRLNLLKELGYQHVSSRTEKVFSEATKEALEKLGMSVSKSILYHMSKLYGLEEEQFVSSYELLEKGLRGIIGEEGTKEILEFIKEKILKHILSNASSLTIDQILDAINKAEIYEFLRNLPAHEHITLLYKNENSRDAVLEQFFSSSITDLPKGFFSIKPTRFTDVSNMLYEELFQIKQEGVKKMSDWISQLHASNKSDVPTKIAGEDSWFFEKGYVEEILNLEKAVGRRLQDNMCILCTYDISTLNEQQIRTLIETHSYVILDDPFMLYRGKD